MTPQGLVFRLAAGLLAIAAADESSSARDSERAR
jgi:hypothetical protein